MSSPQAIFKNLSNFGLPGMGGWELNEELKLVKKFNFFHRIIRLLFGNQRDREERIAYTALKFVSEHRTEITSEKAKSIITRLQPLIHDPFTEIKANALFCSLEYFIADESALKEAKEVNIEIQNFRSCLSNLHPRTEVEHYYNQSVDAFNKLQMKFRGHQVAFMQSIPDAYFKRAFLEKLPFDAFRNIDPSIAVYEANYFLAAAKKEIDLLISEFRKGVADNGRDIESNFKKCMETFQKWDAKISGQKEALLANVTDDLLRQAFQAGMTLSAFARLDPDVSIYVGVVDMTSTRPNTQRLVDATDIHLHPAQLEDLVNRLREARRPPKDISIRSLILTIDEKNRTITEKHFALLDSLEELIGKELRVLWRTAETNYTLVVEGPRVPAIKGIKDLRLSGNVDLVDVLGNYPDLIYLDAENLAGEIYDVSQIRKLCPKIEFIRLPGLMENQWRDNLFPLSVTAPATEVCPTFFLHLQQGTLHPHLAPDAEIESNGRKFHVHRALLANCSHVFRNDKLLSNVNVARFDKVVEFVYTETVAIPNIDDALQIMDAAEELQIPKLMLIAENYFSEIFFKREVPAYQPKGLHAQRALRIFLEEYIRGRCSQEPFPIVKPIPRIAPLSYSMDDAASKEFSDYTMQVGNVSFALHKAILAKRSKYYFNYFDSATSVGESFLERREVTPEQQEMVFKYIYRNELPPIVSARKNYRKPGPDPAKMDEFLWIAQHDELPGLVDALLNDNEPYWLPIDQLNDATIPLIIANMKNYINRCEKYSPARYREGITKASQFGIAMIMTRKNPGLFKELRDLVNPAAALDIVPTAKIFMEQLSSYVAQNGGFE